MVRVASLPDLSRFIRRSNKLPIYNTIHFLVGTESIEVSGCVLSLKSSVLEDLVGKQREVYLDHFTGEMEGVKDCVELLYGGEVELSEENIKTVIKFSVMYEIEDIYNLGIEWVKDNISGSNLFGFIEFGLQIERVGNDNRDLLDLCKETIIDNTVDDLSEISKSWDIGNNTNVIKFLLQAEILYHTLPVLTSWVSVYGNDANVSMILAELQLKGISETMWKFGKRVIHLLEKLSDKVESFATLQELNSMQTRIFMAGIPECSTNPMADHNGKLKVLLSEDYCSFSVKTIMESEESFPDLNHFQFVEILLEWVIKNKPSQADLNRLWCKVREKELCFRFVHRIWSTIEDIPGNLTVPEPTNHVDSFYEYLPSEHFELTKNCNLSSLEISKKCNHCDRQYALKIQLVDTVAGYELEMEGDHIIVDHCYIFWFKTPYGKSNFFSLLTNSYDAALEKVSQSHQEGQKLCIEFVYKCRH